MFQQFFKVDVVIINLIYYVVVFLYELEKFDVLRVIVKGKDYIVLKIKQEVIKYRIEIVENREFVRVFYNMCEIGDFILLEFYQVVVEVLVYVYSFKNYQKVNIR